MPRAAPTTRSGHDERMFRFLFDVILHSGFRPDWAAIARLYGIRHPRSAYVTIILLISSHSGILQLTRLVLYSKFKFRQLARKHGYKYVKGVLTRM